MQRSVYRLFVIVCLVGALVCLLLNVPMAYGQSKEPILIGVMYDQTGPTSVWGVPVAPYAPG
jgi:hypothetical protein